MKHNIIYQKSKRKYYYADDTYLIVRVGFNVGFFESEIKNGKYDELEFEGVQAKKRQRELTKYLPEYRKALEKLSRLKVLL